MTQPRRILLFVLLSGLALAACSSDPTTSSEYEQLADEKAAVEAELAEVRSSLTASESREAEARRFAADETKRADKAAADHDALVARIEEISAILAQARSLVSVEADDYLSGDPEAVKELPEEALALREELGTAIGWFGSADEYNLFENFRSLGRASDAIYEFDAPPMSEAWDTFWGAEPGSTEEMHAAIECSLRMKTAILNSLDEALSELATEAEA